MLDISTCITFPGTRYLGGLRPAPTPPGVPVIITLPFSSVVPELKYEIKYGTPKSKSPTLSSCLTSPLIMVFRWSLAGSLIKSAFTKTGPSGANVSNPLLNPHWGMRPANAGSLCNFLEEMSFPHVYAPTYDSASASETSLQSRPRTRHWEHSQTRDAGSEENKDVPVHPHSLLGRLVQF